MKQKMVHLMAALAMLALTFGAAGPAFAGAATEVVKTKQTALFDLLKQSSAEHDKKVSALCDEMLDYQALAEGSLGAEWTARSDAEKAQFSDLLKQLVRKAYERNLKKILTYDVQYVGEESADGAVMVKTRSMPKNAGAREEPVEITFKMTQKGSTWKVVDLVTADTSMVGNYRSQFTRIIKKDGFPVLIQKMKDKLAKGDV